MAYSTWRLAKGANMRTLLMTITVLGMLAGSNGFGLAEIADLPKPAGIELSARVTDLETKGDSARAQKDYWEARGFYHSAIRLDPKNAALYNKLGITEMRLGELRSAQSHFEKAAKLSPKDPYLFNNLGAVACLQKKYKPATRYLKQALAMDETVATFHINLGEAWIGLGKMDRAMTEYGRALELDADILANNAQVGISAQIRTPEQQARFAFLIAKAYAKRGNVDGALDYLQRAKDLHYSEMADVYNDKEFAVVCNDPRLMKIVPRKTDVSMR